MGRFSEAASYVWGAPGSKNEGILVLSFDEMAEQKLPHSVFIKWKDGVFSDGGTEVWLSAGMGCIKESGALTTVVVSNFGKTLEFSRGERVLGEILTEGQKIEDLGPLRRVRAIDGKIYCVGGNRQAYVRSSPGLWTRIDHSSRPEPGDDRIAGFESVDGFSGREIYAAGWDGEIFQYDGSGWRQIDSPTNLLLTEVCCAGDGQVYIGGREGFLLRGRNDVWDSLDGSQMVDDVWGMAWFKGSLYISGMRGIYTVQDDAIIPVSINLDDVTSFFWLAKTEGILWSVGANDVIAFDGESWGRVD